MIRQGMETPWGVADYVTARAPGIVAVSTPRHGGVWLSAERVAQLPQWARSFAAKWSHGWGDQWFEEDSCAAVVVAAWPGVFSTICRGEVIAHLRGIAERGRDGFTVADIDAFEPIEGSALRHATGGITP